MDLLPLGRTDIRVSRLSLGTMTFGSQCDETASHAILDMALERGVNLYDSAEMYAFPASPETQGESERILGSWIKARGNRDKVVVATKITGPGARFGHIRSGDLNFSRAQLAEAVDLSLKRMQIDCIDLYQTHFPERPGNYFGVLDYTHDSENIGTPFEEILIGMAALIDAGKVRAFGLSNETPWGMARHLALAEFQGLPRAEAIQNPYSLLNRTFDIGHAEIAHREDCGLLAYSPLGFGALSGKYLDGPPPPGSRIDAHPNFKRNFKPNAVKATRAYVDIAREHGLDPSVMAIAFVARRPFVTSAILGVSSAEQLDIDLQAADVVLSDEIMAQIDAVHAGNPNPAP